mmetsp:Transcript_65936/g.110693  ORF Transcript_65936/g.110693 Transcript_65936/m.110693 type:complete len:137 (-) Transcript_65936:623-1033(-)
MAHWHWHVVSWLYCNQPPAHVCTGCSIGGPTVPVKEGTSVWIEFSRGLGVRWAGFLQERPEQVGMPTLHYQSGYQIVAGALSLTTGALHEGKMCWKWKCRGLSLVPLSRSPWQSAPPAAAVCLQYPTWKTTIIMHC